MLDSAHTPRAEPASFNAPRSCAARVANSMPTWRPGPRGHRAVPGPMTPTIVHMIHGPTQIGQGAGQGALVNRQRPRPICVGASLIFGGKICHTRKRTRGVPAASEAAKEAVFLDRLCSELELKRSSEPIHLFCDNKAAIDSAYNPENHARTKHIDRRHYFIRELVEDGKIVVPFVSSSDNLADFFTKPLAPARFFALRDKIMNVYRK